MKEVNIEKDSELDEKANMAFKALREYRETAKKYGVVGAVTWCRCNESGNIFMFTRGEYSRDIVNFVQELEPCVQ